MRLKFGGVKPAEPEKAVPTKVPAKSKKPELGPSLRRSSAVKTAERAAKQAAGSISPAKKASAKLVANGVAAKKTPAKSVAAKVPLVKIGVKPASKSAGKAPVRKAVPKKA